jgi:hypothetical protein
MSTLSFTRVIWNDFTAFLSSAMGVFLLLFGVWDLLTSTRIMQSFIWFNVGIPAAAFLFTLYRFLQIRGVFENGHPTQGEISEVRFFRGRGIIRYVYTFNGENHLSGNRVQLTRETKKYRVGDPVTLMVDRSQPKRAFIRDLYSS